MKRSAFALLAGVLLLGLLPGSVLAKASNVDQSNTVPYAELFSNSGYPIAQTFTAGKTGMLSAIDMFLDCLDGNPASVAIYATGPATHLPTGAPLVSVPFDPAGGGAWNTVSFPTPVAVTSGVMYAIVLTGSSGLSWIGTDDTYLDGSGYEEILGVWMAMSEIITVSYPFYLYDFGFETFVDTIDTTLAWSQSSIQAGASTTLSLTETVTILNGDEAARYNAQLTTALPSWFTPTGITCSDTESEIAPADCTISHFTSGFGNAIDTYPSGDILTIELTGTAAPGWSVSGDVSVSGEGCIKYSLEGPALSGACASTAARIAVTAAAPTPTPTPTPTAAPTAPPTSTTSGSSPDGSGLMLWFLPIGLIAALGGLLAMTTRTRRRIA